MGRRCPRAGIVFRSRVSFADWLCHGHHCLPWARRLPLYIARCGTRERLLWQASAADSDSVASRAGAGDTPNFGVQVHMRTVEHVWSISAS